MEEEDEDDDEPVSVDVTVLLDPESVEVDELESDDVEPDPLDVVDVVLEAELMPAATMVTPIALASTLPAAIATVAPLAARRPRSLAFMIRCSDRFLGASYGPPLRAISIGERDRLVG